MIGYLITINLKKKKKKKQLTGMMKAAWTRGPKSRSAGDGLGMLIGLAFGASYPN
jgi:hypothetical protein